MPTTRTALLLLLSAALPSACVDSAPDSASREVFVPATWTNLSQGVSVTGTYLNGLKKNLTGTSDGWNQGATSVRTLDGQGFVRFTTDENDKAKVLGIRHVSSGDTDYTRADIAYGIQLTDNQMKVSVWERPDSQPGQVYQTGLTYVPGDVFFIEATPTQIKYRKGSITAAPFRTTTVTGGVPFPLQVDTSLYGVGATIRDVAIQGFWDSPVGVTVEANNDLTRQTGTSAWNAGAISRDTISGHGYVSFTTGEPNTSKMLGLSRVSAGNSDQTRGDIDYGLVLFASGSVSIWENGGITSEHAGVATWQPNDVFFIEATPPDGVNQTTIRYYKGSRNSTALAVSAITNDSGFFPLQVDTSLFTAGATLKNVAIHTEPTVHIATQNHFLDPDNLPRCGVNDVLSIGGGHLLQNDDPTTFGDESVIDIQGQLHQYLTLQEIDVANFHGTVILDIEHPHPMDLGFDHTPAQKASIIQGYKRRIIATRLEFTNSDVKLGLYGTVVPGHEHYDSGHAALVAESLATDSLFNATVTSDGYTKNGIDYLIPIVYIRFGCDGPSDCEGQYDTIEADTLLGITGSRDIKRGGTLDIPLLPLMSFWVANGNSAFKDDVLLSFDMSNDTDRFPDNLSLQMKTFAANTVDQVAIWKGGYIPPADPEVLVVDDIVRDGVEPTPNEVCWNVAHDDVDTCDALNYVDYVRIDDYTCWL